MKGELERICIFKRGYDPRNQNILKMENDDIFMYTIPTGAIGLFLLIMCIFFAYRYFCDQAKSKSLKNKNGDLGHF